MSNVGARQEVVYLTQSLAAASLYLHALAYDLHTICSLSPTSLEEERAKVCMDDV